MVVVEAVLLGGEVSTGEGSLRLLLKYRLVVRRCLLYCTDTHTVASREITCILHCTPLNANQNLFLLTVSGDIWEEKATLQLNMTLILFNKYLRRVEA